MEYKGYMIYACVTSVELWTIDDSGDTLDFEKGCYIHESDYKTKYHVQDDSGDVFEGDHFEVAKAWVDKMVAERLEALI